MCVWNVLTRRNVRMGTVPKKGTGFLHETEQHEKNKNEKIIRSSKYDHDHFASNTWACGKNAF